ncbi:MAG: hypothetical protein WBZ01_01360 [Terriglobales bacterium]
MNSGTDRNPTAIALATTGTPFQEIEEPISGMIGDAEYEISYEPAQRQQQQRSSPFEKSDANATDAITARSRIVMPTVRRSPWP